MHGVESHNSVRMSVTRVLCDKTTMHCRYFDTTRKSIHSSSLTPTVLGGRCPLPSEICAQSDPPLQKMLTVTGVPTSCRWSVYVTPKSP